MSEELDSAIRRLEVWVNDLLCAEDIFATRVIHCEDRLKRGNDIRKIISAVQHQRERIRELEECVKNAREWLTVER